MESFRESMGKSSKDLIDQIRAHPFIQRTADGTIPEAHFRRFAAQNYLRLREYERCLAILSARAPEIVRDRFNRAMIKNHLDVELFEELAARLDLPLANTRMTFACHSASCFLLAVATMETFEEAIAALYGIEYALTAGWSGVKVAEHALVPWQDFIALWGGKGIAEWVESIGGILDTVSKDCSPRQVEAMRDRFRSALLHRIRLWDMAFEDSDW